ncbi:MAG: hypothetical protein LBS46_09260 [Dysgonamonadaceae bacterium]|jgi:hypothetical protein|nr:hypothetical protein [Dysgonamonadaceae bacterium]
MKKSILIFMCIWLVYDSYAQIRRDYEFYNHRIDSLQTIYSTEHWHEMIHANYFEDSNSTSNEKKKLITKVRKLFEQKEYANLYRYGHRIIYDMWYMSPGKNSPEIKQMLMELYLQYYFYPGTAQIINSYDPDSKSYYTKKAKKRIIEILENKKTKAEYNAYLLCSKSELINPKYLWTEAAQLMKQREDRNERILKQIRDSLLTEHAHQYAQSFFESSQIDPELIKVIGLLDMKECIPVLKQNLQSCIQDDRKEDETKAYRYALAKLGDTEQRQYILDNLIDIWEFTRRNFAYFQDDAMIWKYIEVNYPSDKKVSINSVYSMPASFMTINDVYPYIRNIPKDLEHSTDERDDEIWFAWAKSLYEWLMANKDKIKFDYDGEKEWFWGH